jgi:murein DD-endopeptidase MepM/ murein hydrolase activator NlpD
LARLSGSPAGGIRYFPVPDFLGALQDRNSWCVVVFMNKRFTFLIFPGAHGKVRRLSIPPYAVHAALVFCAIGVVTVLALGTSYARMLLKVSDYNSVRAEREALKTKYRSLESVVSQTNAKLNSLQSLATEVALAYGFGEARRARFPQSVLALAAQTNTTVDSGYNASLYAFNILKSATFTPSGSPTTQNLLPISQPNVPSIWPVHGRITAGFGERLDPLDGEGAFHAGVDIAAPTGTEVEAPADGIVLQAGPDAGYGNSILIDHGYGITTRYGHLSRIDVVVGQEVKRGQDIGAVGMTGRATGPHLHYEVHIQDTPVNPAKYLPG